MRGIGIVLIVVGAALIAAPKAIYAITQNWKNENSAEPSKAYQIITRAEGLALVIVGIVSVTR